MKKLLYFSLSIIVISMALRSMEQPAKRARVESPMVQLVSSDGSVFELPKAAAELSPALQTLLSFEHSDQEIPRLDFEHIDAETLSIVVKILMALHEKIMQQEAGRLPKLETITYSFGHGDKKYEGYVTQNIQKLVDPFMPGANYIHVMRAFDFLEIPAVVNAACRWFVKNYLEKNPVKDLPIIDDLPAFMAQMQALALPEPLLRCAEKHFLRYKADPTFGKNLAELNIADYIALNGMPEVVLDNELRTINLHGFSGKKITSLEGIELLAQLDTLQRLDLGMNELTALAPGTFQGLTSLEELSLNTNRLSILAPGVFNGLKNLRTIALADNYISSLELGVLQGLSSLNRITLNNNYLTGTREEFRLQHALSNDVFIGWDWQKVQEQQS